MRKKKKEPVLPALVEEGNHHNRLKEGEEVFCYDGKSVMEKVTVIEVDKKAKTVKLSNKVICSRYPDAGGLYHKQGMGYAEYVIQKMDSHLENLLKGHTSRKRLMNMLEIVNNKVITLHGPITELSDEKLSTLIELDKSITKILKNNGII